MKTLKEQYANVQSSLSNMKKEIKKEIRAALVWLGKKLFIEKIIKIPFIDYRVRLYFGWADQSDFCLFNIGFIDTEFAETGVFYLKCTKMWLYIGCFRHYTSVSNTPAVPEKDK